MAQPTTAATLLGLQYLRVVAALLVVLEHAMAPPAFGRPNGVGTGDLGVSMFFIISGAVMWTVTAQTPTSPGAFIRRRLARIVPLYWIALSALIAVALAFSGTLNRTVLTPQNVLWSYLLIPHHHLVDIPHIAPILQVGWSLSFELFFYAVFAAALPLPTHRRPWAIGAALGGLVLIGRLTQPSLPAAIFATSPALLNFACGVALAMLIRAGRMPAPWTGLCLISSGLLLWPWLEQGWGPNWSPYNASPSAMLLVSGVLVTEPLLRRRPIGWLLLLADASYSLFLFHLFFLKLPETLVRHVPALAEPPFRLPYLACVLIAAQIVGLAVHLALERPLLARLRRGFRLGRPLLPKPVISAD